MKIDRTLNRVEEYVPEKCKSCPRLGQCKMKCCDTRHEYEVQVETKLIAHKSMRCTCPLSGEKLQSVFPTGITGSKQYGARVFTLVNTLLTVGYISVDRTKQLLSCLRIPISTGAIQNMLDKAAAATVESVEKSRVKYQERMSSTLMKSDFGQQDHFIGSIVLVANHGDSILYRGNAVKRAWRPWAYFIDLQESLFMISGHPTRSSRV